MALIRGESSTGHEEPHPPNNSAHHRYEDFESEIYSNGNKYERYHPHQEYPNMRKQLSPIEDDLSEGDLSGEDPEENLNDRGNRWMEEEETLSAANLRREQTPLPQPPPIGPTSGSQPSDFTEMARLIYEMIKQNQDREQVRERERNQEMRRLRRRQNDTLSRIVVAQKAFQGLNPPTFDGKGDAIIADEWIIMMEEMLESVRITDDKLKMACVPNYLRGNATIWWQTERRTREDSTISWNRFTRMFREEYFPWEYQREKEAEFEALKQGTMTVREYKQRFSTLSRYAPDMVATERQRIRRFEGGLRARILVHMISTEHKSLASLVSAANRIEQVLEKMKQETENNKQIQGNGMTSSGNFSRNNKRPSSDSSHSSQGGSKRSNSNGTIKCYNCGQSGHYSSKCNNPAYCNLCKESGHTYANCTKMTCPNCGMQGHPRFKCPKLSNNNSIGSKVASTPAPTAPRFQSAPSTSQSANKGRMFAVQHYTPDDEPANVEGLA